jgi:serine/threonine protein phosphatase PrpC
MPRSLYSVALEPEGSIFQDRAKVIEVGDALVIAVADGAGGFAGSEHAAEAVIREIEAWVNQGASLDDEDTWTEFLESTDSTIHQAGNWGETTAVVLAVTEQSICGASVGDSEGWLATDQDFKSLTAGQIRRPFLGSGVARPISFRRTYSGGALVVGTDGLFKYAPAWRICQIAVSGPPELTARSLLDLVRMPNGKFQDDIGFVVCRLGAPEVG